MAAVVYGSTRSLPIGWQPRTFGPLPVPEPLPDGTDETRFERRRCRTSVCASLTVNGATWDLGDADLAERGRQMRSALARGAAMLRCSRQPGMAVAQGYALDVCLTSNCRDCPFQDER
jgi:hypothetical protein